MGLMKKRAREKDTGKFTGAKDKDGTSNIGTAFMAQRNVGWPRKSKKMKEKELKTLELSITASIAGSDVDKTLLHNVQEFLQKEALAGKCSVERGGTAFHLHFQLVVRIQAVSMIAVSKLLKEYLGWTKDSPIGAIVMCRAIRNKGLHTFHGLIGYCMKDAEQGHFKTVDYNLSAEDLKLGLEQYALYGAEESKNRIPLTQRNFVDRSIMWWKFHTKRPAFLDYETIIFEMMRSGKYYPCPSWVVGGYGKGYERSRMQSLWKIMVSPTTVSRGDVANVFCPPDQNPVQSVPRAEWFTNRWKESYVQTADCNTSMPKKVLFQDIQDAEDQNAYMKDNESNLMKEEVTDIAVAGSEKQKNMLDILCSVAVPNKDKKKKAKVISPTRRLWPEEWGMEEIFAAEEESETDSDSAETDRLQEVGELSDYLPFYTRKKHGLIVC